MYTLVPEQYNTFSLSTLCLFLWTNVHIQNILETPLSFPFMCDLIRCRITWRVHLDRITRLHTKVSSDSVPTF